MPDEAQSEESSVASVLRPDAMADKAVRFGCGAILAPALILAVVWMGVFEFMSTGAVLIAMLVVAVLFGFLGVIQGERFIVGLLKMLRILA